MENERDALKMDKAMMETMLYCRDLNLFGVGPPRYVGGKPYGKRKLEDKNDWEVAKSGDEEKDPSGQSTINPALFSFLQIVAVGGWSVVLRGTRRRKIGPKVGRKRKRRMACRWLWCSHY